MSRSPPFAVVLLGVLSTVAFAAFFTLVFALSFVFGLLAVSAVVLVVGLAFVLLSRDGSATAGRVDSTTDPSNGPYPESSTAGALAELRRRYAAGELSEAQFEGRVERLLADEGDPDDARAVLELRYARGEVSDEGFDRKLARLDGTRTVERAERRAESNADVES